MARVLAVALVALCLFGCHWQRPCGCPCTCPAPAGNSATSAIAATAAEAVDEDAPAMVAARRAWTDEIYQGNLALADCLFAAGKEADPAVAATKHDECLRAFRERMASNDEAYALAKDTLRRGRPVDAKEPASDQVERYEHEQFELAKRLLYDMAKAAYLYTIDHPDREGATVEDVTAGTTRPEYVRARDALRDPWGMPVRLDYKAHPYVEILVTSAGPDRRFGTQDDLHQSSKGWQ